MTPDELIAHTQYGDLVGTSSIDGEMAAELHELAEKYGIDTAKWFPVCISLYSEEGDDYIAIYAVEGVSTGRHVRNPDCNDLAASELAIDREIEKRQIAFAVFHLKPRPDRPNLTWPQRRLWSGKFTLIPG